MTTKTKPQKQKSLFQTNKECYLVVDKDKKVVAKFRTKAAAQNFIIDLERRMFGQRFDLIYDPKLK